MRKIFIVCIIVLFNQLNFAQNKKFTTNTIVSSEKIDSLQDLNTILEKISVKNKLNLAYETHILENKFCRSNFKDIELNKTLELILKDSGLEHQIVNGNQLLIRHIKEKDLDYLKLHGQIRDKSNKKDLAFVGIYLQGSNIGSYADINGIFNLTISSDFRKKDDTIIIHRIGYKDKKIPLKEFVKNTDIDLEVNSKVLPLVTILPPINKIGFNSTKIGFGSTQIDNENFLPNILGTNDILRKLQLLPSVYANKDNSANLQIRGGETFETLILIDGLRLYNPTHFYNVFSSINSNYVSTINFYKNNIPPKLRSMTGGIVEMYSKPINHNKTSGDININLMDLSAIINIPISKSLGVNLSARKSIFDQTKNSVFGEIISANQTEIQDDNILNLKGDKDNLSFKYYDINAKLEWEINTKNKLSLSYYNSDDNYLDNYSKVYNIMNNAPKYRKLDFNYNDYSSWQNQGLGLTYLLKWNDNLSTDLAISSVKYSEISGLKIGITSYYNGNTNIKDINNSQNSSISDKVFKIDNEWKISNNKILNFGIDLTNYNVVSDIKINDESIYSKKLSASFFNFYSSYKYNWKKWVLKLSIKSSYYTGTSENYFDPSFSLKYYINEKWSLYTTLNRQHQYLREFEYETPQSKNISIWALADNTDPILSANNYSLGCTYKNHNSYFVFELYQKNRDGLSILLLPRVGNETQTSYSDYKIIFGNGYVKGMDLMWVQKIKNYNSQISYTYSINKRQFSQSFQNQYYPSPDDSRHQLKWAQNYNLKKWEFGLNLIYSSGTPYFDLSDVNKDENRKLLDFNNYIKTLPDYFRADISTGYNFYLLNQKAKIELSVFNLTNRINISNKQVIYSDNEQNSNKSKFVNSQNDLLSRTVNIGINIKI